METSPYSLLYRIFCAVEATAHNATYETLRQENQALREQVALLTHELAQLKRLVFGTKSERFVPSGEADQLPLFEANASPAEVEPPPRVSVPVSTRPRQKPVRQVLPSHLPRQVIVIEPEGDLTRLKKIGEEVTETLDYRPARLVVLRRVRPKYVDPRDDARGVLVAALPARPIDKGLAEPGLLSHVVIEKYVDHLPLYRQVQRFTRAGITLSDSTLGGWIAATADLLVPLYEALASEARASGYIQADETPIPVLDAEKEGSTHRGYYWVYHAPGAGLVVMDYQRGRGRDGPTDWLVGYQGALQSDGYAVYDGYESVPGITSYGCWAHARRGVETVTTFIRAPTWSLFCCASHKRKTQAKKGISLRKKDPRTLRRKRPTCSRRSAGSTPSNGCCARRRPRPRSGIVCARSRLRRYWIA